MRCGSALRLGLLLALLGGGTPGAARAQTVTADELELIYILHFAKFARWPDGAQPPVGSAWRIGIYDRAALGGALEYVRGEKVLGRRLEWVDCRRPADVAGCHLIYLNTPDRVAVAALLRAADRRPILTVGQAEDFLRMGGVIQFAPEGRKIRFDINPDAVDRAGLKISAQLFEVARRVRRVPPWTTTNAVEGLL